MIVVTIMIAVMAVLLVGRQQKNETSVIGVVGRLNDVAISQFHLAAESWIERKSCFRNQREESDQHRC